MRFVGALETLLDPAVGLLDALHGHFDARLASRDVLELMAGWLGVELDESWPIERWRELIAKAPELSRRRGTRVGLEMALAIAFPELPLRVEDLGGVVSALVPEELPQAGPPQFVVYCEQPLDASQAARLDRMIKDMKPVHVNSRLRLPRARSAGS
jgi:phage tail-like protein